MSNSVTVLHLLELLKEKSIESTREMMQKVEMFNAINKESASERINKRKEVEQNEHEDTPWLEVTTTANQATVQTSEKEEREEEEQTQQPFLPSSGSTESLIELVETSDKQNDGTNYHSNNTAKSANRELAKFSRELAVSSVKNNAEAMSGGNSLLPEEKSQNSIIENNDTIFASKNDTFREHSNSLDNVAARDYKKWCFANYTQLPASKRSEASLSTEPNYVIAIVNDKTNNKLSVICSGEIVAHGALSSVYVGHLRIELHEEQQEQETSNNNDSIKTTSDTERLNASVIIKIIRSEPTNMLFSAKFLEHCAFPLMKEPHDNIIEIYSVEIYIPSRESVEAVKYQAHISDKNAINDKEHEHGKVPHAENYPWRFTVIEELAEGGSLQELIKHREVLTLEEVRWLALELLQGLNHLHNKLQVVHNDVKPLNILLCKKKSETYSDKESETESTASPTNAVVSSNKARVSIKQLIANSLLERRCKLADFGLMTPISLTKEQMEFAQETPQEVLEHSAKLKEIRGSTGFLSPEMCVGMTGNPVSDIWSLGITIFYVATGFMPWSTLEMQYPELIINSYRTCYANGKLFNKSKRPTLQSTELTAHSTLCKESYKTNINNDDNNTEVDEVCFGPVLSELNHAQYDPDLRSFVHLCLTENYLDRPNAATLLKHPFITQRTN